MRNWSTLRVELSSASAHAARGSWSTSTALTSRVSGTESTAPLAAGAGARLGEAELTGGGAAVALLVFALVSTAGVLVPIAVALVGGRTLTPALTAAREWLEANTLPITITVLAVLGSYFLGQGIGHLG